MSIFQVTVDTSDDAGQVSDLLAPGVAINANNPNAWGYVRDMGSYFVADGARSLGITFADTMVAATGTITSTGAAVAAETVTVANIVLTAVASGAVPANGEWNVSAVVATQAASIALAINSIATLTNKVTATSNLGIVTVTSVVPGIIGNTIQLSEAATNVTVAAFSGGAQSHTGTISAGR